MNSFGRIDADDSIEDRQRQNCVMDNVVIERRVDTRTVRGTIKPSNPIAHRQFVWQERVARRWRRVGIRPGHNFVKPLLQRTGAADRGAERIEVGCSALPC